MSGCRTGDVVVKDGALITFELAKELGSSVCSSSWESESYDGATVTNVEVSGTGVSPEVGVRIYLQDRGGNIIRQTSSSWLVPEDATTGDWHFGQDSNLTCGTEDCADYIWTLAAMPSDAQVAGRTGGEWCDEFGEVTIEVESATPDGETSTAYSPCVPGSGRFQLVAADLFDNNYDMNGRLTYLPVQISGSGTLTNASRVTSISKVSDGGYPLRVLKVGARAVFSANDLLQGPAAVTYPITGTHNFSVGQLHGMPKFLHPPIPIGTTINAQVDMTWSCGTAANVRSDDPGYSISTAGLGCPGLQKITFRPQASSIKWELYGNNAYEVVTPRASDGSFTLSQSGLVVTGKVTSWSSNTATLQLASATYAGTSYCTAGTYTVGAEM